jgi:hypothetical protein
VGHPMDLGWLVSHPPARFGAMGWPAPGAQILLGGWPASLPMAKGWLAGHPQQVLGHSTWPTEREGERQQRLAEVGWLRAIRG